jgi:LytS/YehU family sensor histidine kinase
VIAAIAMTAAIVVASGLVTLAGRDPMSPWTVLILAVGANVGLVFGLRFGGARSTPAAGQRRMLGLLEHTLPDLRLGLNPETAERTVHLLQAVLKQDAVAITDRERLLAFSGRGADHHIEGQAVGDGVVHRVIDSGRPLVATAADLGCDGQTGSCPLRSAIVVPLTCDRHVVGSLAVYQARDGLPDQGLVELTRGLAGILSLQLELSQAHRAAQIAETAKLNALRAQINPHFLFNTLNTIAMKARTDPEEARRLLVRLSDFLRYAMKNTGHIASFGEEFFFVRTYLFLEKARFEDRLNVRYDIDPQCLSIGVPVLTIQPLIENAVKHGIASKADGGTVELKARLEPIAGTFRVKVCDNGVGIEDRRIPSLLTPVRSETSALANIHERLTRLYGGRASLEVDSQAGKGTTVTLSLPLS